MSFELPAARGYACLGDWLWCWQRLPRRNSVSVDPAVGSSSNAGTYNVAAISTTNGGATWTSDPVPLAYGDGLSAVACPSISTCFAAGYNSIISTTDGGSTWRNDPVPQGSGGLGAISCPSTSDCTGVVGASIVSTTDGGSTWTSETAPAPVDSLGSVACPSTSTCFAVSGNSFRTTEKSASAPIISTTNGGATWTNDPIPSQVTNLSSIACQSALDCTAVGSNDIVSTTDGGSTWTSETAPAPVASLDSVACPSTSTCLAVGVGYGSVGGLVVSGANMNAPSVVTASLPSANAGVAYSATLNATGGFSPYSWSVSSGSLPGGLSLDPSTGSITGRPVSEGTFKFTVEVSGANSSTTTQDLSIVVGPAPPLACSSTGVGSASYSGGYWIATSTGAVYSCGDAPFYGSLVTAGVTPLKPVVGIAAAPDDKGYYEVASDGGVFAFGPGANFYGSTGCLSLNQPIVGIEVASNTTTVGTETACGSTNPDAPGGYRLIARDGGVFSFGNATFAGSLSGEGVSDVVGAAGA